MFRVEGVLGMAVVASNSIDLDIPAKQNQGDAAGEQTDDCHASMSPLIALCAIARFHQIAADPQTLAHKLGLTQSDSIGKADLLRAAAELGLKAKLSRSSAARLPALSLPALAVMRGDSANLRVVVLAQADSNRVLYQELSGAARSVPVIESLEAFSAHWSGELFLFASRASMAGALAKFDFSWFIPSMVKYRKLLLEVLMISFMLQLFALVSPLFFQVVMDKVLVHKGVTTLDVLIIGLVIVVVFESVLNALRAYIFSHTTSRIDVELGARLFRHLVHLPLSYFQARRVGPSSGRRSEHRQPGYRVCVSGPKGDSQARNISLYALWHGGRHRAHRDGGRGHRRKNRVVLSGHTVVSAEGHPDRRKARRIGAGNEHQRRN